jgi:hypothetical protein
VITQSEDSISNREHGSEKEPTQTYNTYVKESNDEATPLSV